MNEKLSFQNITEALAHKAGVQKKVSETFTKAFFDTIIEALYMGETTIKVKDLGTFKLVEVGSRESVNVSNGERIVIPGYKKVSFTPEDSVVEFINTKNSIDEQHVPVEDEAAEAVFENGEKEPEAEVKIEEEKVEVIVEQEEITDEDTSIELEDLLQTVVPEDVETPQDEFAGIDMLISTPESVNEIRQQLTDATAKMDEAIKIARKAVEDKLRLQKLLERLEANAIPENVDIPLEEPTVTIEEKKEDTETASTGTSEEPNVTTSEETASESLSPTLQANSNEDEEERKRHAFERVMQEKKDEEEGITIKRKKNTGFAWFIFITIILLATIIFFLYKTFVSIDAVKDVAPIPNDTIPRVEQPEKKNTATESDSSKVAKTTNDSIKASAETLQQDTNAEPARPTVYAIQKGESLTRISQRFYGTKDSVMAIIRINDLIDPNNVPIGTKIKLP